MHIISPRRLMIVALFEWRRVFATKRGWLGLAAYCLVWFVILKQVIARAADIMADPEMGNFISTLIVSSGFADPGNWLAPELYFFFIVAAYTLPPLVILNSADQTCSDNQRGTLKFLLLRTTRDEILFGRFVGQVLLSFCLYFVALLATLILVTLRDSAELTSVLVQAMTGSALMCLFIMPFIALMTLLNSVLKNPKMCIVVAILFFTLAHLVIAILSVYLPAAESLTAIIPSIPNSLFFTEEISLREVYLPVIQVLGFLLLSRVMFARSGL